MDLIQLIFPVLSLLREVHASEALLLIVHRILDIIHVLRDTINLVLELSYLVCNFVIILLLRLALCCSFCDEILHSLKCVSSLSTRVRGRLMLTFERCKLAAQTLNK